MMSNTVFVSNATVCVQNLIKNFVKYFRVSVIATPMITRSTLNSTMPRCPASKTSNSVTKVPKTIVAIMLSTKGGSGFYSSLSSRCRSCWCCDNFYGPSSSRYRSWIASRRLSRVLFDLVSIITLFELNSSN